MIIAAAAELAMLAQMLVAAAKLTNAKQATGLGVLMNSYIVALDSGMYSDRAYSIHAQFYRDLASRGVNWTTVKEYRSPLFTGAVLELLSDTDLARLTDTLGDQFVRPVHMHNTPRTTMRTEPRALRAHRNGDIPWSHTLTGVDKVHAAGYRGEGVTIGIIDTGIDYTHPALGGGFGPGYKVIGGYDFVGDEFTGRDDSPPPRPKPDPLDKRNGHGTKVAGIVGANPNLDRGVIGVAYMAKLNAYRVINSNPGLREDIIIDALIRAHEDGNDIVTISAGYTTTWKPTMASVIIDRMAARGRIVTTSIGNHGEEGAWGTDYIGSSQRVLGVGCVTRTSNTDEPVSDFAFTHDTSATGPTSDMHLGVAISAPGEAVMSTTMYGGYGPCYGTSMAAPFVAGSIALWLQVRGKSAESTFAARAAFQNTALPMLSSRGNTIDTVAHQGAGLIQVHDAIYSSSRMSPAELLLNDTMHARLAWTVYIHNLRQEDATYTLTHTPAGTIDTMVWKSRLSGSLYFVPQTATVRFSRSTLTVPAGSIGSVVVTVRPPRRLREAHFPVYSGYIIATGSDGSTVRSVYLGLAASMKRMRVLNPRSISLRRHPTDDRPMSNPAVYTMQGTDTPRLSLDLCMSTPLLRLELVDASARACSLRRFMSRCTSCVLLPNTGSDRGICSDRMKTVGLIEERWDGGLIRWGGKRDWSESITIAQFADGSPIRDGRYRLLLRVLKRYGDLKKKSDYETWISPVFIVRKN